MNTLTITPARFKEMALRMRNCAAQKNCTLSHQSALQLLAQTLYGKPYEEIKVTILDKEDAGTTNQHHVVLLNYGGQDILMSDGQYQNATNPGTDLELPYRVLENEAERLATLLGCEVKRVQLPQVLGQDYGSDDEIVELAKQMGYARPFPSIFECLIEMSGAIIYDLMFVEPLVSDAFELLEDNDEFEDVIMWMPELRTIEATYEYYFTFRELCNATSADGKVWFVDNSEGRVRIEFVY